MKSQEKTIERHIKNLYVKNLPTATDPGLDRKILGNVDGILEGSKNENSSAAQLRIRRIVTKSKMTKLAAAAVMVVSVLIGVSRFGGSIDGASVAFAQMTEAMQKMPWMHVVCYEHEEKVHGEEEDYDTGISESWLSYQSKVYICKRPNGYVDYCDGYKHRSFEYKPESKTIMIRYWDPSYSFIGGKPIAEITPENFIHNLWRLGKDQDSQITLSRGQYDGKAFDILEVTLKEANRNRTYSVFTDPVTKLPESVESSFIFDIDGKQEHFSEYVEIEYPEDGPESIYDLGVPLSAEKIFHDNIPTDELIEVWDTYIACKNNFCDATRQYAAIITEASRARKDGIWVDRMNKVSVEYRDRTQYSSFCYQLGEGMNPPDEPQTVNELPQSFDELLEWSKTIKLYPYYCGKTTHVFWKEKGHYLGVTRNAWRILHPEGYGLVQDDYSIENNLICLERIQKHDSSYDQFLYYLNPRRDYICERYLSQWKIIDNEPDSVSIRDVLEYGQTDSGKWYPRMIQWISFEGDEQTGESTSMIYLRTDPEFPEGVFDPKADQPEYEEDVIVPGRN
jgi:hypothetical protein